MSRYIDADLMREKAYQMNFAGRINERELFLFNRALSEMPTVDAVQVVRCKDCKWFKSGIDINGNPFTRCDGSVRTYGHTSPDWFCADGERKDDEQIH